MEKSITLYVGLDVHKDSIEIAGAGAPMKLARLARANDLAAVRVPQPADEAVGDLVRAREDSVREQRNARHRLKPLLLRNAIPYAGKTAWTGAHLRWLATLKMEHHVQRRPHFWARSSEALGIGAAAVSRLCTCCNFDGLLLNELIQEGRVTPQAVASNPSYP